jgi:hypothetical protein
MCEPTTIAVASLAVTAASGVANYMAQSAQADAQEDYNRQLQENAKQAYLNDIEALRLQQDQDEGSAQDEIVKNQIAAREARARAKTAAGEAGVSGLSVDALLADYDRQEANFTDSVLANLGSRTQQRKAEENAAVTRYQSRYNSASPVSRPSMLNTGLNIAGQGLGIAQDYQRYKVADRNK